MFDKLIYFILLTCICILQLFLIYLFLFRDKTSTSTLNNNNNNNNDKNKNNQLINEQTNTNSLPILPDTQQYRDIYIRSLPTILPDPQYRYINIHTRGPPPPLKQIGTLLPANLDKKIHYDHVIYPLYGRPLYSGSITWNYFTKINDLQVAIVNVTSNNKDCTDTYGCKELYSGDMVSIPSMNNLMLKVDIYNNSLDLF